MIPREKPKELPLWAQPTDPNVNKEDAPRLAGQNLAILERLRQGPATNKELAEMSLKYTSRLSDLRANGFTVKCERKTGGLTVYTLEAA
jgi:hypothetical protein